MMYPNLKAALVARGIRQVDLALSLQIGETQVSRVFNGRRQPSPGLRRRIAEILNANEKWLFSQAKRIPPLTRPPSRKSAHEPNVEPAEAANVPA